MTKLESKLIEYDDFWIKMTKTRNYTAHIYSEVFSEKIYLGLPEVLPYFQELLRKIKEEIKIYKN